MSEFTNQDRWTAVDRYFNELLVPPDPALDQALEQNAAKGLPVQDVSPLQGKLLYLLAGLTGARRILEIGTLGGYSTIWLARALPHGGHMTTLEVVPKHADVARVNLARAGLADRVEVRLGPALESLAELQLQQVDAFDLIFIDADKRSNPEYLRWALKLSRIGTLIIGDNVVRNGQVADGLNEDPSTKGVRRFTEMIAAERRLSATAIQTVGSKGYDGFLLARVIA